MNTCHVCGSASLRLVPQYEALQRVTSDCKPWAAGGRLAICSDCDSAQAVVEERWSREAAQIYEQYTIYHQSKGIEQSVFDQASGAATSRSIKLMERLRREVSLPGSGRLLDVGCGNGALLRAFAQAVNGWSLAGLEVNDRHRAEVEGIPGVERLFTGRMQDVAGRFQVITLIHALEHIPSPRDYLTGLWDKLEVGGLLIVQVPDCEQNPFLFAVADHSLHCFLAPLRDLIESAGFAVDQATNNWVAKELTVVARKSEEKSQPRPMRAVQDTERLVLPRVNWLINLSTRARALAAQTSKVGIFGTSIAATWLFAELGAKVDFFVDEDPNRIGRSHLDRPIIGVKEILPNSELFVPLPPFLARAVSARIAIPAERVHLPPEIT
jgi:2-polyprenyl-3-methyl-5-hydroxy-6-metoxy-1,4-benzoquinol methylase